MYLYEMLDWRAFSSLWFWVLFILLWLRSCQRIAHVPIAELIRAKAGDVGDFMSIVRIYATKPMLSTGFSDVIIVFVQFFGVTALVGLGLYWGSEIAFAVLTLILPAIVLHYADRRLLKRAVSLPQAEVIRLWSRAHVRRQIFGALFIFVVSLYATARTILSAL